MQINIESFLNKYYTLADPIILACSGGPDSMYILYNILHSKYKDNLVVSYFNHKLRFESDEEEAFLVSLGKKHGFKVEIAEGNINEIKKKFYPSMSIEELARKKRYEFFDALMHIYNTDKIILAHHLDDKIETFIFNLIRGTKLTGLVNMTEKSGAILRPLLKTTKKEILEYLDKNKLKYFIDRTNFEPIYDRNKLRLEVMPVFEEINANYRENINNLMNYLGEIKYTIDIEITKFLDSFNNKEIINLYKSKYFEINDFFDLSLFMQKEVIRYIYYISNSLSTIGLSESNINEVIKFIKGKNNKTIKEIKNMKLKKENKIILY